MLLPVLACPALRPRRVGVVVGAERCVGKDTKAVPATTAAAAAVLDI